MENSVYQNMQKVFKITKDGDRILSRTHFGATDSIIYYMGQLPRSEFYWAEESTVQHVTKCNLLKNSYGTKKLYHSEVYKILLSYSFAK